MELELCVCCVCCVCCVWCVCAWTALCPGALSPHFAFLCGRLRRRETPSFQPSLRTGMTRRVEAAVLVWLQKLRASSEQPQVLTEAQRLWAEGWRVGR